MNRSGEIASASSAALNSATFSSTNVARRPALVDRRLGDVDRVLVGAGQEPRVVAEHPVPARDRVGADDLVQRVETGLVVGVRDRRGQVEARPVGHGRPMVAGLRRVPGSGRTRPDPRGRILLLSGHAKASRRAPPVHRRRGRGLRGTRQSPSVWPGWATRSSWSRRTRTGSSRSAEDLSRSASPGSRTPSPRPSPRAT